MRPLLICIAALFWVFAACASPGEKHLVGDQSTPTNSPTAKQKTDRDAPARPAMQQSEPGAEAQVRYVLEVIDFAKATGEVDALLELSREGCVPCADAYDSITGGKPEKVVLESVVASSAVFEGDTAQVDTMRMVGTKAHVRTWRLNWDGKVWTFGAIVDVGAAT